ncbi:uncharacterized protein F54H12.2-like [Orussus abietinus]|uniref:uncharacterized protein F54H12.2-like n=1 Tax=Orussus abietinus TaxID=222816 RepID=UPI000C715B1F|nr:uncharacterized protein F54H12.2-like [Orussus abietinus]
MAFLHAHSHECLKFQLSPFSLPPTQTTIDNSQWVHYKPISSLSDGSPIEFVVPGHGDGYLDLAYTMLSARVALQSVHSDIEVKTLKDVENVGPINNLLHSMFNHVDVFFNQKLVSPPNNAYAYTAYIETLLNYGSDAKKSHLTSSLWYGDTADRFLLNGVEIRLRLVRSCDSFCLMNPTNSFKVHILEATLPVRRVNVNPGILLSHERALAKTAAKYPLTRVEVKVISMHSGLHSETLDNAILGQLPKRIILGFVDNRASNGDRKLNPFNFAHYNINYLSLYVDGIQVPSKPLQPDFTKNRLYEAAYHTLFSGTGTHFLDRGNCIDREKYPDGYCLFAFDLTPGLSANENSHWNLIRHGSVRIEVRFENALSSKVNCIIYAEYENVLEIDASRHFLVDFNG